MKDVKRVRNIKVKRMPSVGEPQKYTGKNKGVESIDELGCILINREPGKELASRRPAVILIKVKR